MAPCPDCESVKMLCDPPEGDGRCSACHGSGLGELFDTSGIEILNGEQAACEDCYGTGRCQTCRGTGLVEELFDIRFAA